LTSAALRTPPAWNSLRRSVESGVSGGAKKLGLSLRVAPARNPFLNWPGLLLSQLQVLFLFGFSYSYLAG